MDEGTIPNAVITIKFMLPFYQAVDVSTLASHAESIRTVSPVSGSLENETFENFSLSLLGLC
jgi:hypothetical protein